MELNNLLLMANGAIIVFFVSAIYGMRRMMKH